MGIPTKTSNLTTTHKDKMHTTGNHRRTLFYLTATSTRQLQTEAFARVKKHRDQLDRRQCRELHRPRRTNRNARTTCTSASPGHCDHGQITKEPSLSTGVPCHANSFGILEAIPDQVATSSFTIFEPHVQPTNASLDLRQPNLHTPTQIRDGIHHNHANLQLHFIIP
ncbi:unnamed protein product, partial [Ectocarpus sp. 12 AP-2014]